MIRRLLLLASVCGAGAAHAQQAPVWQWAQAQTSGANTALNKLATDAQGNTYIAGAFTGQLPLSPTVTLTSDARTDGFVAKYDPAGTLLWAQTVGGPADEQATDLAVDAAGNAYITGGFAASMRVGGLTQTGGTQVRTFIAKLDAQGQPQWLRQDGFGPGTSGGSSGTALAVDAAGALYLTGRFSGTAAFSGTTLTGSGSEIYVVKYDAQGAVQWAQQGGRVVAGTTPVAIYGHRIVVGPTGEVFLLWGADTNGGGFGTLTMPASLGGSDVVVVKFSAQGIPQWLQRAGGPADDRALFGAVDANGHLLVSTQFTDRATFGSITVFGAGTQSAALVQYDAATGNVGWIRTLASSGATTLGGVATDAAGNVYAAGNFTGTAEVEQRQIVSAGGTDAVVLSYSPQGTLRWVQKSSGSGDELGLHLALDGTGQLVTGGPLRNVGQFGNSTVTGQSTFSSFVARLSAQVTAAHAGQDSRPLTLYPNPARQRVTLHCPLRPRAVRPPWFCTTPAARWCAHSS